MSKQKQTHNTLQPFVKSDLQVLQILFSDYHLHLILLKQISKTSSAASSSYPYYFFSVLANEKIALEIISNTLKEISKSKQKISSSTLPGNTVNVNLTSFEKVFTQPYCAYFRPQCREWLKPLTQKVTDMKQCIQLTSYAVSRLPMNEREQRAQLHTEFIRSTFNLIINQFIVVERLIDAVPEGIRVLCHVVIESYLKKWVTSSVNDHRHMTAKILTNWVYYSIASIRGSDTFMRNMSEVNQLIHVFVDHSLDKLTYQTNMSFMFDEFTKHKQTLIAFLDAVPLDKRVNQYITPLSLESLQTRVDQMQYEANELLGFVYYLFPSLIDQWASTKSNIWYFAKNEVEPFLHMSTRFTDELRVSPMKSTHRRELIETITKRIKFLAMQNLDIIVGTAACLQRRQFVDVELVVNK